MQPALRLLPAVALALLSASAFASTTTYTSSASFLAKVQSGSYTENFDALGLPPLGSVGFSGGGFSYAVSAPSDLFNGFFGHLEANQENEALTITFTSGNVRAVGGDFFAVDINDVLRNTSITLTLNDGTTTSFAPSTVANGFRGFISDIAITSLVFSAPGQSLYAALDNLTVGNVPEPTSMLLAGLGLAGLLITRRRTV